MSFYEVCFCVDIQFTIIIIHYYPLCRTLVFVGVHARRTDYKHHLKVLISGKLVTKKYFEDAMVYIKDKHREEEKVMDNFEVRKITKTNDRLQLNICLIISNHLYKGRTM